MADKKAALVNALRQLGSSFEQLSKAQALANQAVVEYASALEKTEDDPKDYLATFPNIVGDVSYLSNGVAGLPSPGVEVPKKRGRGAAKEKKVKDPLAPRRPPSAYIEYQNSVREDFRKQYSDLPYSEVLKKIGLVWQGMTEAEKKPWHDITGEKKNKYLADKEGYEQEQGILPAPPAAPKEPKKRGRKSNAEKAALAAAAAAAADIPVDDGASSKKKKEKVVAQPESESEDDDSDDDSSDDDSSSSESESEASPVPVPVKAEKKDKHKSKKSKH
ncbi:hypothetical protein JCM10908_004150 [Rhodotorula pacifica]|uniref:uncharacterized protein n=1 Tax=Rhodotorula pacifica TaxID=1495444 RepID=UPI00316EDE59